MSELRQPSVHAVNATAASVKADALVLFVSQNSTSAEIESSPLPDALTAQLHSQFTLLGVSGASDEVVRVLAPEAFAAKILVFTGLGKAAEGNAHLEAVRRASGAAMRALGHVEKVALALPEVDERGLQALVEGSLLGAFSYSGYKTDSKKDVDLGEILVLTSLPSRAAQAALKRATIIAEAVNNTRLLVNEPPNKLYPETFALAAKDLAKTHNVKVTVFDEKRLEKEGFGGILGVGKGSQRPPRLVKVEYSPAKAKKHLALVGKGITFDTGGISLKPGGSMMTMKSDMGGAAAVLNVTLAAAELALPVKVTAWLCIAENMPGGKALKPEDVITIHGGKTVEVLNTDAEGRLVMADGLAAASSEHPDVILDVATLTGAQVVALGGRYAAVMGAEQVRSAIAQAGDVVGEPFWPMPLPEYILDQLKSPNADLKNITGSRDGGMLAAGLFLQEFVGPQEGSQERISWGHLDIAGPAFNEGKPYGYTPTQGTGAAVRTVLEFAASLGR